MNLTSLLNKVGLRNLQLNHDEKRFESLSRFILSSMEAQNEPKLWYVSVVLSQDLLLLWLQQLKHLLLICCKLLRKLKPTVSTEAKKISIYLNMLIIFTDCGNWKIFSMKGGEALRPSLQQLCANVLGHLNTKGFYPSLKDLLMAGLARSEPSLKSATFMAVITLALRPLILSNFSDNLSSLFILNILSVPGLILHLSSVAPDGLKPLKSHGIYEKVLSFLQQDQSSRIVLNSLECSYTLCLLANLLELSQLDEEVFKEKLSDFVEVVTKLLSYCQSYIAKKQSNLTNWHPILGWFKQPSDERLNNSIPHVRKQLQSLWRRKAVNLLFEDLLIISESENSELKNKDDKGNKKPWSRISRGRSRSGQSSLSSSQSDVILKACVMYQTVLSTFSQIKLDILTGLSYQEGFVVRLWKFFESFGSDDSPDARLSSLEKTGLFNSCELQASLVLFCDCCSHLMPIVDDSEMYEQQKPFRLDELVRISAFLNNLVFKMLWNEMVDETREQMLNSAYTLLMILYDRDCRRTFTTQDHWLVRSVKTSTVVSELDKRKKGALMVIQKVPHVLPHRERVQLFRKLVAKDKEELGITRPSDDFLPHGTLITVQRTRLLEDGYEQLSLLPARTFKGLIRVRFINEQGLSEAGIDQDGVFKEFLEEVVKKGFDPSLGLFKMTSGEEERLFPSSTSCIHNNHLKLFEFLGKVLGKALYEGMVVEVPFAPFFLNHVLGRQHSSLYSSIDELPSLDQSLYKSLCFIKHYDGDIRDLELTFSFDEDVLGKVVTHQLMSGGNVIHVTNDNKISYVHLMAHYRMCVQIREQTAAFIRGFKSIVRHDWLQMFSGPELQRLISGDSAAMDLSDLRRHTRYYGGYHSNHRVVNWLWDVLEKEFSEEEKSRFLKFVTSCSKPPLLGFAHLEPPFSVRCVECNDDEDEGDTVGSVFRGFFSIGRRRDPVGRLPTSSTCFNLLKLPNYRRKSTLKEKLRYAINANAGFELS
ncbi:ubiquitin-protein ligase E3B-like isoform X1 [Orbicella faveolata]|uniref:ubiquitin-protein ligase E3B-like isoform X1 n=2 Tax=Orbicella faveolata TaxID=48498 RepID=UPI0009E4A110|nr:ubiquitin-protein ligase E3B-like isoform X1 [Orbicella faveolata]